MDKATRIYIAGHTGLVGSALLRSFSAQGFTQLIVQDSKALDLRDQSAVNEFFQQEHPELVLLAAAKVGGIWANATQPAAFLYDNLMIETNVIHAACHSGVRRLLFLGSSCIYPKHAPQPLKESALLTGPLEETNAPYALAKIAGVKLCEAYRQQYGFESIALMPTNMYGPNDSYDLTKAHVVPALLRRCHEAKLNQEPVVTLWGTGTPKRELMHVDDLVRACHFLLDHPDPPPMVNIGSGEEVTIAELAEMIRDVTGFTGRFEWDASKPDGTPQKRVDLTILHGLGFHAEISLKAGLTQVYADFCAQYETLIARSTAAQAG